MTERTAHSTRMAHTQKPFEPSHTHVWHRSERDRHTGIPFDAVEDSLVRRTHSPRLATLTRGR